MIPATTPTADVTQLFTTKLLDPRFEGAGPVTGTVSIGNLQGTLSGAMGLQGGNSTFQLTLEFPGIGATSTSTLKVDGRQYESQEGGPWLEVASSPGDSGMDTAMAAAVVTVTDQGVVTKAGEQLHHLVPANSGALTGADLGMTDPAMAEARVTLEFYARDDGSLAVMSMSLAWSTDMGGSAVPATLVMDVTFEPGDAAVIAPPDQAWTRFTSTQHGYAIGFPATWYLGESSSNDVPDTFAYSPTEFAMVIRERQPKSAADNLAAYVRAFKRATPWKAEIDEATKVAGRPAWRLAYHHKVNGKRTYLAFTLLIQGRNGYQVAAVCPAGSESEVMAFHELQLATLGLPAD